VCVQYVIIRIRYDIQVDEQASVALAPSLRRQHLIQRRGRPLGRKTMHQQRKKQREARDRARLPSVDRSALFVAAPPPALVVQRPDPLAPALRDGALEPIQDSWSTSPPRPGPPLSLLVA
jgi:hypothetical protein